MKYLKKPNFAIMQETTQEQIQQIYQGQSLFFKTNRTKDVQFRLKQLRLFLSVVQKYSKNIEEALWSDLRKSPEEAFLTEISIVIAELKNHINNIEHWAKPQKVKTPIHLMPATSKIHTEPLGLSLIITPWNYPFQLTMNALVGAISSGCCAILKPSPDAPATAKIMEKMVSECFETNYIALIQGGRETNTILLQQRFDIIFFTGSTKVGKVVMKAAAEHLTPVVLELGGKSPCIVDGSANIKRAAKRIVWGKLINAGQTCIAPDYLFVHEKVKDKLVTEMKVQIQSMYGEDPQKSRFYPRIINDAAFQRLTGLMKKGNILVGGETDEKERFIAPTIIDELTFEDEIMQGEIFGPILPVFSFKSIDKPLEYINSNEKPLAFYFFGKIKIAKHALTNSSSGGGCINDTIMHIANDHLPFGGVGGSGIGRYHSYASFLAFSNQRSIVQTATWIDLPFKYVPFKWFKWLRKIL